jgi:NifB/MoaA-like Fe-S oxidoreductase
MARRRFPVLVATRVTEKERAMIGAAAEAEGLTIGGLVRKLLLPGVARLVAQAASELQSADGPERSAGSPRGRDYP